MYFEKVADRGSWDFALGNVASALDVQNGTIFEARIAVGGVAARPLRLGRVENAIAGRPVNEETLEEAGRLAVEDARPLQFNAYQDRAHPQPGEAGDPGGSRLARKASPKGSR